MLSINQRVLGKKHVRHAKRSYRSRDWCVLFMRVKDLYELVA